MAFSLKPGVSYIALSIAIYVVLVLFVIVVVMIAGQRTTDAYGRTTYHLDTKDPLMVLLLLIGGLGFVFITANGLLPSLCRWSSSPPTV